MKGRTPQLALFCALALALPCALFGQTCTITSPTPSQLIQAATPIQLTATVNTAPTAYRMIWSVDNKRWRVGYNTDQHFAINDYADSWQGPWTVTWYTGLNGDGPHFVSAVLYDIFGTALATCATVNFTVRIEGMSTQSISPAIPTSGRTSSAGFLTWDGSFNPVAAIDGVPLIPSGSSCQSYPLWGGQTGGWILNNFKTTCWPNGTHEIVFGWNPSGVGTAITSDPYVQSKTFTSSGVTGNNITITGHPYQNGNAVVFSSTGTLPAPLVAGSQWFWTTSSSSPSNTATLAISGGVITVTCSAACGATTGTPVYLLNIQSTNQTTGLPNCDGYYTAASGSGNSFTVTAPPGCPNGALANANLEVDVNPYFARFLDANTFSVSATPGGSTVALTNGGSGTHTVRTRMRSPYWTSTGDNGSGTPNSDLVAFGGRASILSLVTFSNGTTPMELRPCYWEMHLVAGASPAPLCAQVANTDLSKTTLAPGASGLTFTEVDDGGQSGVCSVNTSAQTVIPIMAGWCQVQISCSGCAAGAVTLPTVTVYVQVQSGSVTFPHFTHGGPLASSFSPGNSFFPLSAWQVGISFATPYNTVVATRPLWYGPMFQQSNLNSAQTGLGPGQGPGTTPQSSCPNWASGTSQMNYEEAFASTWNIYLEHDLEGGVYAQNNNASNTVTALAAILNNTQYNRQACVQSLVAHHVSTGRYWSYYNDDELSDIFGSYLMPNPTIGGANWTSAVVSGGTITFNVQNINSQPAWSQSTGAGNWVQVVNATSACLNGWYPLNATSPTAWTSTSSCASGTYAPTGGTVTESAAQLVLNPSNLTVNQNTSILPSVATTAQANQQSWTGILFSGSGVASSNALSSIVCSNGTCTVNYATHGLANGQAIRIWNATTANLDILAPVSVINANSFSIAYPGTTGRATPANGTYSVSTDPNLYLSVDPNWGANPLAQFYAIVAGVSGHPIKRFSMLGSLFTTANGPGVYSWEGNPANTDAAFGYIPTSPGPIYGFDAGVWPWMNYSQGSSGLATRGFQIQPRSMLVSVGIYSSHYCRGFQEFNPACDHPAQLYWRPETLIAQMMGMLALNVSALRLYNFTANMDVIYSNTCCGWQSGGTGTGAGINPILSPKQWSAMAHANALIKLREDTELQPPANKPYLGPMFLTDAHASATYGNELMILCGAEMPYGMQTVTLPTISGGSMLKYILTGYSLRVSLLAGNPTTDTTEFCSSPGQTTTYVAQPPGVNVLNNITFAPPAPLPFGASKFLVQVGYYPQAMQDDPVTDCTAVCIIAIDHHNTAAWYRVIYADSNNLPRSISDPMQIPSQGLN